MDDRIGHEFRTTDPAAAMEDLRASFGRLNLHGPVFDYGVSMVGDRRFSVGSVYLGGEVGIDGSLDGVTIAAGPPSYRWQVGDDRGDLSSPVIYHPDIPLHVEADHSLVAVVRFDSRELERLARLAFDNPKLHLGFDGPRPVSPERGARWAPLVHSFLSQRDELMQNELIRASAYRELAVAAWGVFRFEHTEARNAPTSRGAAMAFRIAADFIEENAHRPITVEDVAAAAGVSSVQLGRIFLHHATPCESPRARIRRIRLEAARREVARMQPGEFTLGEIAARWGFTQAGFARHYRRAYGADPHGAHASGVTRAARVGVAGVG